MLTRVRKRFGDHEVGRCLDRRGRPLREAAVRLSACWIPIAASTAENASSTGTPAATNAPKATRRITNVTGSDSRSAFSKSLALGVVERLVGARLAELLDDEARRASLERVHRIDERLDPVH